MQQASVQGSHPIRMTALNDGEPVGAEGLAGRMEDMGRILAYSSATHPFENRLACPLCVTVDRQNIHATLNRAD